MMVLIFKGRSYLSGVGLVVLIDFGILCFLSASLALVCVFRFCLTNGRRGQTGGAAYGVTVSTVGTTAIPQPPQVGSLAHS